MSNTPSLKRSGIAFLSAVLVTTLLVANSASAQQGAGALAKFREACSADLKSYCSGIQPGGGRILACLKENESKLSSSCKQALEAAQAAREQRQQQGN